jgi:sulfur relay protein TusB/DsrH
MESFLFLIRSGPRSPQVNTVFNTIKHLSQGGHAVSVFLLQDGVLAAIDSPWANATRAMAFRATFRVLAEDLTLRGLCEKNLSPGVTAASYAELVEAMMEGHDRVLGAF